MFQKITQIMKIIFSSNDYKWKRMALSCSKNIISIIKNNNV